MDGLLPLWRFRSIDLCTYISVPFADYLNKKKSSKIN